MSAGGAAGTRTISASNLTLVAADVKQLLALVREPWQRRTGSVPRRRGGLAVSSARTVRQLGGAQGLIGSARDAALGRRCGRPRATGVTLLILVMRRYDSPNSGGHRREQTLERALGRLADRAPSREPMVAVGAVAPERGAKGIASCEEGVDAAAELKRIIGHQRIAAMRSVRSPPHPASSSRPESPEVMPRGSSVAHDRRRAARRRGCAPDPRNGAVSGTNPVILRCGPADSRRSPPDPGRRILGPTIRNIRIPAPAAAARHPRSSSVFRPCSLRTRIPSEEQHLRARRGDGRRGGLRNRTLFGTRSTRSGPEASKYLCSGGGGRPGAFMRSMTAPRARSPAQWC